VCRGTRGLVFEFAEPEGQLLLLAIAHIADRSPRSGGKGGDLAREIARVLDHVAVDRRDDVSGLEAGFGSGALWFGGRDKGAGSLLNPEALGELSGERLHLDADPAALHVSTLAQLRYHRLGG